MRIHRIGLSLLTAGLALAPAASADASTGTWDRAWGKDVISGNAETAFEICTVASSCSAGEAGGLAGEMNDPTGAAVDSAGNVYVAESGRIDKFDSSGNFLRAWGKDVVSTGPGDAGTDAFEICVPANGDACKAAASGLFGIGGEMPSAYHVAVGPSDAVYVVDVGNHRIQKFDSSGSFQRLWGKDVVTTGSPNNTGTGFEICVGGVDTCKQGSAGSLAGEMSFPQGVGVDANGNVYVPEFTNQRVQKFDSNGNFLRAWGRDVVSAGPGDIGNSFEICVAGVDTCKAGVGGGLGGEFNLPFGVATDAASNVYIADADNRRIDKFDSSGNFLRAWGRDVVSSGPGSNGTDFEICVAGVDTCKAGVPGALGGELSTPRGLAMDLAGSVYATDGSNHRIQMYDSSGNFLRAWGKDVVSAGPGNTGIGFEICVAANGDTCNSGAEGELGGEMRSLDGLGATATGEVYAADEINDRIQKFVDSPPPPAGGGGAAQPPTTVTGRRAAALKKCKKKPSRAKRKKCKRKAKRLPR
ncbi:MAG: hypothetical protein ACXWZW_07055 [Solirubrobacterales bacterium]